MKKLLALSLILILAACGEANHEYETEIANAYDVPMITIEKDVLYHGERRVEITNNSDAPISYMASEILFDVDYTEQSIDVWAEENLTWITNAIFDHILDRQGQMIEPNESMVLIIDMASHPYDINFSLNFDIDGEEVTKHVALTQTID